MLGVLRDLRELRDEYNSESRIENYKIFLNLILYNTKADVLKLLTKMIQLNIIGYIWVLNKELVLLSL